ncbi:MAG TPA: histidine kinase N-terminal 7TM domain-containing protein [Candidatus Acidoferrum sp.]|nr:histidine kinase N-terminal 7TM domain-containing protein [Candidatus Acidoferrum sp.]
MLLYNLTSLYLLTATLAVVYCAVQIRALSKAAYTTTALQLCAAVSFYILGYVMELNSSTAAQILFWNRVEYLGIPFIAALWLTTSLIYTGHFSRHKTLLAAAIFSVPALTFVLRFTNDAHHLYFKSLSFVREFGGLFLVREQGPFMYLQAAHSALMILLSVGLLLRDVLKGPEREAGKIVLAVTGALFALAGLLLPGLPINGVRLDFMALCLPVSCLMLIVAIIRYDLLEIKSIARSKVFEASSDAILMLNRQNRVLDFNGAARRLLSQLGIEPQYIAAPALFAGRPELLHAVQGDKPAIVKLEAGDGERWFDITTEQVADGKVLKGRIKIFRDVTDICQVNEELSRLAMVDELSVLSNRRAFMKLGREWTGRAAAEGVPLHLLMMDLDFFKDVNDRYGHPTGDLVIHEFAQILKEHFGEDALIARLGGEEFAVMTAGLEDAELRRSTRALLEKTDRHPYHYFGNTFHVTVSIGVTRRREGQKLEDMMRIADKALYDSKEKGRCCVTVL